MLASRLLRPPLRPVAEVAAEAEEEEAEAEALAEVAPVAAEPEEAARVPVVAARAVVEGEAAPERAEARIGWSSRSPIAPKRLRTTSRRALLAWSGAPRSTGACSVTAAFCPTLK